MPMPPPEIERTPEQHDNDVAEILLKLEAIERKADAIRRQIGARFDPGRDVAPAFRAVLIADQCA